MLPMNESPKKTLRSRTAEFVQQREDLDKETLVEFVQEVVAKQETITLTAHRDEEGNIDCVCMGDLCDINHIPTEKMPKCKRLEWIYVGEKSEEKREHRDDHIEV